MAASYSLGIDITERETRAVLVNIRTGESIESRADEADGVDRNIIARLSAGDEQSRAIASLPGAGIASPSTMLIRMSEGRIDLLMNSRIEATVADLVAPIRDGILPGFFGYMIELPTISDPEAMGFRIRTICDSMRSAGIHVRRFVAISIPPLAVSQQSIQTLANVLAEKIRLVSDEFVTARGLAILAAIRANQTDHAHQSQLIHAMAPHLPSEQRFRPVLSERRRFDELYRSRNDRGAV